MNNNSNIYYTIIPDKNYFVNNGNLKMNYDLLISKMNNELSSFNYIDILTKNIQIYIEVSPDIPKNDLENKLNIIIQKLIKEGTIIFKENNIS